jgi:hypothetical protein
MIKIQKIWMAIFIAMFVIPEILWGPVANFIYSFINPTIDGYPQLIRNNFLFDFQYEKFLKSIIIIQTIGILVFSFFWFKHIKNINSKIIFLLVSLLCILISLICLFVSYLVFIFNPGL